MKSLLLNHWLPFQLVTNMELSILFILHSRQEEQTCPPESHVQMSIPVKRTQTSAKANQLDTPAAACLSVEPPVDSISPSKVQTDTVLPQSCKIMSLCVHLLCLFSFVNQNPKQFGAIFCFCHIFAHCGLIFYCNKKSCTSMDSGQPCQEKEVTQQCLLCIVTKLECSKS